MDYFSIPRLVDYSSDEEERDEISRSEPENPYNASLKKENVTVEEMKYVSLPIPSEIQQMFNKYPDETENDDSSKHGGKIRSFPHERGVWATYVYIEYSPVPDFFQMVDRLREVALDHGVKVDIAEHFHVSLTKTLKLRHHWITPFMDSLKAGLSCFYRFKIVFQSLEVYENEENTRTFLGMKAHIGYEHLLKMVKKVDESLAEFKLPCFYDNPSFHLSFASCVGSQAEKIESFLADLSVIFQLFVDSHSDCRTLWVSKRLGHPHTIIQILMVLENSNEKPRCGTRSPVNRMTKLGFARFLRFIFDVHSSTLVFGTVGSIGNFSKHLLGGDTGLDVYLVVGW
ncbi:hypothetical protein JTE90_002603 [Oedothorax gibbosus]|uniref:U6 snRNA phosphodiesterase n=1 Tax=Oedothorax gibbosus TaxID=931172 RepID=A0AAV6V248_9ARAC|nr:hypothetical protein JTE90_002603 [Oedothorax gibbosus]